MMKLNYDRPKDESFRRQDSTFDSQCQQDDIFFNYYSEQSNHNFSRDSMKQSKEESFKYDNMKNCNENFKYSFNEDATSTESSFSSTRKNPHSFDDSTSCHGSFCGMTWHGDFEPKSYSPHHEYNDNREPYFCERGVESTFEDCRDSYEECDDEREMTWSHDDSSIAENEFTEDLSIDDAIINSISLNASNTLTIYDPYNDTDEEYSVASTKTEISEYSSTIDLNTVISSASEQYTSIASYESYNDSSSGHSSNNSNISVTGPMSHDLEKGDNYLINNTRAHSFPKSARSLDDACRRYLLSDEEKRSKFVGTGKSVHSASSHPKIDHTLKSTFVINEFEGSNIEVCIENPKSPNKDTVCKDNSLTGLNTSHDSKTEEMMLIQRKSFDDQSTKDYDLLVTAPNTMTLTGQCSMALIPHQQDITKRGKRFRIKSVIYHVDQDKIEEDNEITPSLNWMASDTNDTKTLFGKQKSPFCLTHVQPQGPIHHNSPCRVLSEKFKLFRLQKGLKQTKSIVLARKRSTSGIFTK